VNNLSIRASFAALVLAAPALAGEYRDHKIYCPDVMDLTTFEIKSQWANKDLSKAQCLAEIKQTRATIREIDRARGNIATHLVGCALYCSELYKLKF
jgi:hypothetical protein